MSIEGLVPAIPLKEHATIQTAINDLQNAETAFGVVISVRNEKIAVISIDDLTKADGNKTVGTAVPENREIKVVESPETLEEVVENHAKYLELRPNLREIVVTENETVVGVLPRNVIITGATRVVTRGAGILRMEGPPLGALFFRCPEDNERRMVTYYNPDDPPLCSKQHVMVPEDL
jgi:hypothetical protein